MQRKCARRTRARRTQGAAPEWPPMADGAQGSAGTLADGPDAHAMFAVEARGLVHRFRDGGGVDGIDLLVPRGAVYALLGANGSGKTTTIRMLLGLLQPQAGTLRILGRPDPARSAEVRRTVGALVEAPSLYPHLSGRRNLEVTARLLGVSAAKVDQVLGDVGLEGRDRDRRVRDYSLGMKQRLGLALALVGDPELLVLDEPGNGLDPAGMLQMRQAVAALARDRGITVLLSSHLLGEVEQLATHVGVIKAGRLRYQGSLAGLVPASGGELRIATTAPAQTLARLAALAIPASAAADGGIRIELAADASDDVADAALLRHLVEAGVPFHAFHRSRPTLESRYFELIGDDAR